MGEGPGIEGSGILEDAGEGAVMAKGAGDPERNLASLLDRSLQGAELYGGYASHAGSDRELAAFFRKAQEEEERRAERAKQLLATRPQGG